MSIEFIRIEGDEGYLNCDVRIEAIDVLADNGKRGTKVILRNGTVIPTKERTEHLKARIERLS